MKQGIVIAAVVTSLVAVGVVAAIGLTQQARTEPAALLVWPKGSLARPQLVCPRGTARTGYDGPGFSSVKNPMDAVVEVLPAVSEGYPWQADVVAGLTRDDLVEVWHTRDESGGHVAILLEIGGAPYALYDVSRWLMAGGEPIRWRDNGWVVGGSTVCQFPSTQLGAR